VAVVKFTKGKNRRLAAAAVEMAVVTPLLLTMLFGIIEYGWVFTVRQGLTNAAREGARVAALPGSTDEDIQSRVADFLAPLGVTTYNLAMTHSTPTDATETVTVTVPYADVTLIGCYFGSTDYDLGATCSMRKEGMD
jgi:Flp pilus assembly protein TadG